MIRSFYPIIREDIDKKRESNAIFKAVIESRAKQLVESKKKKGISLKKICAFCLRNITHNMIKCITMKNDSNRPLTYIILYT